MQLLLGNCDDTRPKRTRTPAHQHTGTLKHTLKHILAHVLANMHGCLCELHAISYAISCRLSFCRSSCHCSCSLLSAPGRPQSAHTPGSGVEAAKAYKNTYHIKSWRHIVAKYIHVHATAVVVVVILILCQC